MKLKKKVETLLRCLSCKRISTNQISTDNWNKTNCCSLCLRSFQHLQSLSMHIHPLRTSHGNRAPASGVSSVRLNYLWLGHPHIITSPGHVLTPWHNNTEHSGVYESSSGTACILTGRAWQTCHLVNTDTHTQHIDDWKCMSVVIPSALLCVNVSAHKFNAKSILGLYSVHLT